MWCLWNRPRSYDSTGRKACRGRKSCIDWYWDSICTDRKGVISCRIWTWKVPPVHIWTWSDSSKWPQTFGDITEKSLFTLHQNGCGECYCAYRSTQYTWSIILVKKCSQRTPWAYLRTNDQTGVLNEETIHLARFFPVIENRLQEMRRETQMDETLKLSQFL